MSLIRLLMNIMDIVSMYDVLCVECKSDRSQSISVYCATDYDGGPLPGTYVIEYRHGKDTVASLTWDNDALDPNEEYKEVDFPDFYENLKEFESESGVNLLSEDWELCKEDQERIRRIIDDCEAVLPEK